MTQVRIEAGICGLVTIVSASKEGLDSVNINLESDCPKVIRFYQDITSIDMMGILSTGQDNPVLNTAVKYKLHPSCPVPVGVLKAAEVAIGIALPKDAVIKFTRSSTDT